MNHIVIGAGFGDEGKGSIVSELIKKHNSNLVVRFNGGHQAGHTVVHEGKRHVFSNIGSGALQGVATYWSKFCTVHPKGLLNELDVLSKLNVHPVLYIDPLCPIVTPFDIIENQLNLQHGTVGVGFGSTIERNEKHYRLVAQDLLYPVVLREKLRAVHAYYYDTPSIPSERLAMQTFMAEVDELLSNPKIFIQRRQILDNVIFEGAQGVLLDQRYGFFPNVTRSNTTSENALKLRRDVHRYNTHVHYVTRAYHTRHGKGPLPYESIKNMTLKNNAEETNVSNKFQGDFRTAPLNVDLLKYALACDEHNLKGSVEKTLHVTCCDQVEEQIPYYINDHLRTAKLKHVFGHLGCSLDIQYKYNP